MLVELMEYIMSYEEIKSRIIIVMVGEYEFKLDYKVNAFVCDNLEYLNIARCKDQYPDAGDVMKACIELGINEEFVEYLNRAN